MPPFTMCKTCRQGAHIQERTNQNTRSPFFSLEAPFLVFSTPNCCRKAEFSRAKSQRPLRATNQYSQPSHCLDHGLECGGNRLNNQWLSSRRSFGERQVSENTTVSLRHPGTFDSQPVRKSPRHWLSVWWRRRPFCYQSQAFRERWGEAQSRFTTGDSSSAAGEVLLRQSSSSQLDFQRYRTDRGSVRLSFQGDVLPTFGLATGRE